MNNPSSNNKPASDDSLDLVEDEYRETIEELTARDKILQYHIQVLQDKLAAAEKKIKDDKEVIKIAAMLVEETEKKENVIMNMVSKKSKTDEMQDSDEKQMAVFKKERDYWKKMTEEARQKEKETAKKMIDLEKKLEQMAKKTEKLKNKRNYWKLIAEEETQKKEAVTTEMAAVKESEAVKIEEYKEKLASSEKERDKWKEMAEEAKESTATKNSEIARIEERVKTQTIDLEKERNYWKMTAEDEKQKNEAVTKMMAEAKESETAKIEEYKEKINSLERERDNWKEMTEEAQKMNADIAQQRDSLLDQKANLRKKAMIAIIQGNKFRQLATALERWRNENKKEIDNYHDLTERHNEEISKHLMEQQKLEEEITVLMRDLSKHLMEQQKLKEKNAVLKRDLSNHLTEQQKLTERHNQEISNHLTEQQKLEEENAVLKREDALATCKICYDHPVQNVFTCGHAACSECSSTLQRCHICRQNRSFNDRKIYFT